MKKLKFKLNKMFSPERIYTSIGFSAILGVSYWATTVYEKAFASGKPYMAILAFFSVALFMLICGGRLLDYLLKK